MREQWTDHGQTRVMVLVICTSSDGKKFHENVLSGFRVKSGHEITIVKFQKNA